MSDRQEAIAALAKVWRASPKDSDERFIYKMTLMMMVEDELKAAGVER